MSFLDISTQGVLRFNYIVECRLVCKCHTLSRNVDECKPVMQVAAGVADKPMIHVEFKHKSKVRRCWLTL